MEESHGDLGNPARTKGVERLTRRQFLKWSALAAAVAGGGYAVVRQHRTDPADGVRIDLPLLPNQNPAFRAAGLPDGGLLVWTRSRRKVLQAYRLAPRERLVWKTCDGTRSEEEVIAVCVERNGDTEEKTKRALRDLMDAGIIVAGGHIVAAGRFPRPAEGGCYHRIVRERSPDATGEQSA